MIQFQESKFIQKLFSIAILLLFYTPISLQEDPTFTDCYNSANYTSKGQFEINLINTLLPALASNGVLNYTTFYNTTAGSGEDRIYGFAQCMSGATVKDCSVCLRNSTVDVLSRCPNKRQAVIRYYNCILRYSDKQFVSEPDSRSRIYLYPIANVSDPDVFNKQLGDLMKNLSREAASDSSKFAVGTNSYNDFSNINAVAQCTRDLSETDCHNCIDGAIGQIPTCCNNRNGGNVYSPSCNIRYEVYSFYPAVGLPPPPAKAASPPPPLRAADPPSSDTTTVLGNKNSNKTVIIVAIPLVAGAMVLLTTFCTICFLKRKKKLRRNIVDGEEEELRSKESRVFDLGTLKAATNNFSDANKLGEGGFGPVYKGKLSDGQEIAVKRLLMSSSQGMTQLKNEIALIAKLEHRNLVRLLGCCLEQGEKLLVYEYVANTSLDKFLFDPIKCAQLDWEKRYKIIKGIARGLLYLHEDSRLRIIHRDLKAGNVLLDGDMNPKISDFGLAKIFGGDQTQGNTSNVAGTFGYMAPEYVRNGQFSIKTDVFSFGVLVLEIVAGRKNSGFHESESAIDLLSYTWEHWSEGTHLELINQTLGEHCPRDEVVRCIHIGLLCIQEDTTRRPTMSTIVLMLSSNSITLPLPHPPPFCVGRSRGSLDSLGRNSHLPPSELSSQNSATPISINEMSISELDPR